MHATIHYNENFHVDDRVRKLEHSDSFSIPAPEISYGIWKYLSNCIEKRRTDQKNTFYVQWDSVQYNVIKVNTLKELAKEFQRLKKDVKMEKYFLKTHLKHPLPAGITRLGEGDEDIFAVTEQILYANLYLKEDTPLSTIDRTMADYTRMDNEQLHNYAHYDRQFSEDEIHCVLEILNNQDNGKDAFIVVTPELNDANICEEYCYKKGVHVAEVAHVILNINLSKGMINLTEKDGHWVYCAIPHDKETIYGDPLGSQTIPKNLIEVLNPIYLAKYGKDIIKNNMKIINVSNNPNFPRQTCSTICGLVSAMICITSFNNNVYNEIMFAREENVGLQFIKRPTMYCEQIRLRFLKVISSRKPCVEFFIPSQINFSFEKETDGTRERKSKQNAPNAWKSLISKSRTKSSVSASSKAGARLQSTASNDASSGASLSQKTRSSDMEKSESLKQASNQSSSRTSSSVGAASKADDQPQSAYMGAYSGPSIPPKSMSPDLEKSASPKEASRQSSSRTTRTSSSVGASSTDGVHLQSTASIGAFSGPSISPQSRSSDMENPSSPQQASQQSSSRMSTSKPKHNKSKRPSVEKEHENQNVPTFVKSNFVGLKSFQSSLGYPNNDGYCWSFTKKAKGPMKYKCSKEDCTALKHLYKTKVELKKKRSKRYLDYPINVNYITKHSCEEVPKTENVLFTSYRMDIKLKNEKVEADEKTKTGEMEDECEEETTTNYQQGKDDDNNREGEREMNAEMVRVNVPNDAYGEVNNVEKETVPLSNQNEDSPVSLTEQVFVEDSGHMNDYAIDLNENSFNDNDVETDGVYQEVSIDRELTTANSMDNVTDREDSVAHGSFPCYKCQFVATSLGDFIEHTNCIHEIGCEVCNYLTTTEELLNKHKVEKEHFKCDQCEYRVNSDDRLKRHKERTQTVNEVQFRSKSTKRKNPEDDMASAESIKKKMRISPTIREASVDDIFDDIFADKECENQCPTAAPLIFDINTSTHRPPIISNEENNKEKNEDSRGCQSNSENSEGELIDNDDNRKISTKTLDVYKGDLDINNGHIAFVIKNHQSDKKPKPNRNLFNWGNSQSQRGKTTYYGCNGHFECSQCQIKAKAMEKCRDCKIPLSHKKCAAKKYVYFCKDDCVRETFKNCCDIKTTSNKLVLLYIDQHSCISTTLMADGRDKIDFKKVKTKEDIVDNVKTLVEKESEHFSVEDVEKLPSNVDGNNYYIIENTKKEDMKQMIRDGRKWQKFTQTSSQSFSKVFGEVTAKKIRKYRCSNQFFCFNQKCPFKKRFELVNQVRSLQIYRSALVQPKETINKQKSCSTKIDMDFLWGRGRFDSKFWSLEKPKAQCCDQDQAGNTFGLLS